MQRDSLGLLRVGGGFVSTAALCVGVWWAAHAPWARFRAGVARFDDVVVVCSAVAVAAAVGWVCLVFLVTGISHLPGLAGRAGRMMTQRVAPVMVRQALPALFGVTVAASPVVSTPLALATTSAVHVASADAGGCLSPVGRPAAAADTLRPVAHSTSVTEPSPKQRDVPGEPARSYEVQPGDSLWSIAADHLGPAASAAEIRSEWPRWFAANRDEIGTDPDVIRSGTILTTPDRP